MKFHELSRLATCALLAATVGLAQASTTMPTSSSYLVTHRAEVSAAPAAVYAALGQVDRWWNGDHTYSGKSANLKLDLRAGGCFCESWDGGSVEHARVILALRDRVLRLEGGLGPLQEKAVTAILTFTLTPEAGKTGILVTYRVRAAEGALDHTAEAVDKVIGEQVQRLAAYVDRK